MNIDLLDRYRITHGDFASSPGSNYGAFLITSLQDSKPLKVICAPMDEEWQHVSVSKQNKCPSWEEMCQIKDMFWDEEDTVLQFHPKKSAYINNHPYCLHLWRKRGTDYALPPCELVGVK